ncbi:hypothetical protein N9917_02435 [Deltaproteobacteria bacterium]|nr:hypothetical protein [Deltaproteobacteria bacterium]
MARYAARGAPLEAEQYTDAASVVRIIQMNGSGKGIFNTDTHLCIPGVCGMTKVQSGDYVLKDHHGNLSVLAETQFEPMYVKVAE